MNQKKLSQGLNATQLKQIAVFTMLLDHIGVCLAQGGQTMMFISSILRTAGRISFPIYCFLLAEGFVHTKNVKNYIMRLAILAFCSEIPFDLFRSGRIIDPDAQNVVFTLFLGLLVMEGCKIFAGSGWKQTVMVGSSCLAATFLRTDYGGIGVLLVFLFYKFREKESMRNEVICFFLILESIENLGAAALSLLFLNRYNKKRGTFRYPFVFYLFYPVHLILLSAVSGSLKLWMGG